MRINKNLSTVANSLQEINVLHTSNSLSISLKYVPYHEKKNQRCANKHEDEFNVSGGGFFSQ